MRDRRDAQIRAAQVNANCKISQGLSPRSRAHHIIRVDRRHEVLPSVCCFQVLDRRFAAVPIGAFLKFFAYPEQRVLFVGVRNELDPNWQATSSEATRQREGG